MHVNNTQMVVGAVRVGEVARKSVHSRNISQRTDPWRSLIYKGQAKQVKDKESGGQR